MTKLNNPIRAVFLTMSLILWLGIYLSGFANVHWLLYIPTIGILLAAITGICPSHIVFSRVIK